MEDRTGNHRSDMVLSPVQTHGTGRMAQFKRLSPTAAAGAIGAPLREPPTPVATHPHRIDRMDLGEADLGHLDVTA